MNEIDGGELGFNDTSRVTHLLYVQNTQFDVNLECFMAAFIGGKACFCYFLRLNLADLEASAIPNRRLNVSLRSISKRTSSAWRRPFIQSR